MDPEHQELLNFILFSTTLCQDNKSIRSIVNISTTMVIHKNLMTEKPLPGYLLELLADYREFNPQYISQVVRTIQSSLEFSKAVARGVPLKYRAFERSESNAVSIDPSLSKQRAFEWSRKDLEALSGDLAVAVTPNGRADDLHHVEGFTSPVFLEPAEVSMSMKEFMSKLDTDEANAAGLPVYYLREYSAPQLSSDSNRIAEQQFDIYSTQATTQTHHGIVSIRIRCSGRPRRHQSLDRKREIGHFDTPRSI